MQQANNTELDTPNLIPKYRQDYITLRLSWLIELLQLNNSHWPVDYIELLKMIKSLQFFPFEYVFIDLPEKYDAITEYVEEYSLYIFFVNKNKVIFPCEHPTYIKLNFSIAREIAHIVLGHLLIPQILKTPEELSLEELEADEFALRFLNAEGVLFSYTLPDPQLNLARY